MANVVAVTKEIIDFIRPWSPNGICEIGAGDGTWIDAIKAAGIPAIGYDSRAGIWWEYNNPSVLHGDHVTASQHSDMTLLIVWPPDGVTVQHWIGVWKGDTVILCAHKHRPIIGHALDDFDEKARFSGSLEGRKGDSFLAVYVRRSHKVV